MTLDLPGLQAILGYPESPLPAPFDDYLLEALDFASQLTDIKACSRIIEDIRFEPSNGRIMADGRAFLVGKTVLKELRNSEELLFLSVNGKSISEKSARLLKGRTLPKGISTRWESF